MEIIDFVTLNIWQENRDVYYCLFERLDSSQIPAEMISPDIWITDWNLEYLINSISHRMLSILDRSLQKWFLEKWTMCLLLSIWTISHRSLHKWFLQTSESQIGTSNT